MPEPLEWSGCYDLSWKGLIVPEAFAHPAKMACGLLEKIVEYGLEQGFWAKGSLCLDPFAGVGTGGIICASRGLRWLGVELEPRFVGWAEANFALHRRTWEGFGDPLPKIVQGDSRRLREMLKEAEVVMSSPPYEGSVHPRSEADYEADRQHRAGMGRDPHTAGSLPGGEYGTTPGQLSALPPGSVGAVLSSPPYEAKQVGAGEWREEDRSRREAAFTAASGEALTPGRALGLKRMMDGYGSTEGQLGAEQGDTFWSAARDILLECHAVLTPGAVSAWVVKAFVRKKKLVDFPGDWARLLEACGFEVFLRVHALLTKTDAAPSLFGGEDVKVKERKSFFRRLAEKKGSPRVDYEEVIWARRI